MRPPWSMIFFTTLAGSAQGLVIVLVVIDLLCSAGLADTPAALFTAGSLLALLLSGAGLVAATFHLGHPLRAWRAAAAWRTSWLSREVIVLPAFMALVALWGGGHWAGHPLSAAGVAAAVLALVLYLCTAMIYGAVKAIPAWAPPWTPLNFSLIGLSSGLVLSWALAAALSLPVAGSLQGPAWVMTLLAAAARGFTLWRNTHHKPKTTLQSALGVRHPRIRQISQGAMGGSFNTREFFHGRSAATVGRARWFAGAAGFALPAAALLAAGAQARWPLAAAASVCAVQWAGLLAERWSFFVEGEHVQNHYHQAIG